LVSIGIQPEDLRAVRERFESPTMVDPFDASYEELRAQNRTALDASLRDLSALAALLGNDSALVGDVRALELSVAASQAAIEESNLMLNRSTGASFDEFGDNLLRRSHASTLRPLQLLTHGTRPEFATATNQLLQGTDQTIINKEASRPANALPSGMTSPDPVGLTKKLYPVLARRNARFAVISDVVANEISTRADELVRARRSGITNTVAWLIASLFATLALAAAVGHALSRSVRRLGQHAHALVNGERDLEQLPLRGPRELAVSARALNELATTLDVVQEQADALIAGRAATDTHPEIPANRLGSSVQLAVRKLSESIQLNNQLRDQFAHAATHDSLTGLPNRHGVYRELDRHLSTRSELGVLFIDLDRFKQINDERGHDVGDQVLQTMSRRFIACVGSYGLVARLGGDEFVVICSQVVTPTSLGRLADQLRAQAAIPVIFAGAEVNLGASVGVAIAQLDDTSSTLLRRADQALYQAKAAGRNRTSIASAPFKATATSSA
jgi:diguanylate cyclase (GGDEF)-like protein